MTSRSDIPSACDLRHLAARGDGTACPGVKSSDPTRRELGPAMGWVKRITHKGAGGCPGRFITLSAFHAVLTVWTEANKLNEVGGDRWTGQRQDAR